jgi:hypothetical protein
MFQATWIQEPREDDHIRYYYGQYPKKGQKVRIADNNLVQAIRRGYIDPETIVWCGYKGKKINIPHKLIVKPIEDLRKAELELQTISTGIKRIEGLLKHYKIKTEELTQAIKEN